MVDFVATLTAISSGLNVLKDLNQIDREFDKATLKLKIGELAGALSNAQITLAEAQRELMDKAAEIENLRVSFRKSSELVEWHGFKYEAMPDASGKPQGYPYCPRCLTQDGALLRLAPFGKGYEAAKCPECKSEFHRLHVYCYADER